MERIAEVYARALFEAAEKEAPGFAFVVRHMDIHFNKPAHMDDVLDNRATYDARTG